MYGHSCQLGEDMTDSRYENLARSTHLLLLDQVNLGRIRAEVAVRPQQRLRAGVCVVAGHDGQLQAHAPPTASLRLGLQRQDVLDVQLRRVRSC